MTDRAFVDTSVWVFAVDRDEPVKQARARSVLDPSTGTDLVVSAQVLGDFYVTVTRKLARAVAPDVAAGMVERMRRLPVVAIDADHVAAAIVGSLGVGISYWDALLIAAAALAAARAC
jgi:predicted nucleic acid-binding protein